MLTVLPRPGRASHRPLLAAFSPVRTSPRPFTRLLRTTSVLASPSLSDTVPPATKPHYTTTPIYYVNAAPHIGHLHSLVLADVIHRWNAWKRGQSIDGTGSNTRALLATGTDEHGLKIQKTAEREGREPKELCDSVSQRFRALAEASGAAPHTFIRTTEPSHAAAVTHLWRTLRDRGHIYKGRHEGWYSESDEAFYTPAQIKDDEITGPQGRKEKIKVSIETGSKVEWSEEENYKFRLSNFREPLIRWLKENPSAILPAMRHEQVLSELESGLQDLSISRPRSRLSWGIPVPDDDEHTIYVWVDALTNYLTVTGYPWLEVEGAGAARGTKEEPWKGSAWPADVHVVGKDIVRFHAIYWPAMLLGAGLPLPKHLVTHGHWTMNKFKMSKSRGNVADPFQALEAYGRDELRWFLMRVGGALAGDSDYAPSIIAEFHRKYLAGQLGNLLSRVMAPKVVQRLFADESPSPTEGEEVTLQRPAMEKGDEELLTKLEGLAQVCASHVESFELARCLEAIHGVIFEANRHMQEVEPWSASTSREGVARALFWSTETLRITSTLLRPFMPGRMEQLLDSLRVEEEERGWTDAGRIRDSIKVRYSKVKVKPLFPRLDDALVNPAKQP